MSRRHVLVEIGQALDFSDIPFIDALPSFGPFPLAFKRLWIRRGRLDFEGLPLVDHSNAFDDM